MQSHAIAAHLEGHENLSKELLILPLGRELTRESRQLAKVGRRRKGGAHGGEWHKQRAGVVLLPFFGEVESRKRLFQQMFHDIFTSHSRFSQLFTKSVPPNWAALESRGRRIIQPEEWASRPPDTRPCVHVTPINVRHHVHLNGKHVEH